eukprot:456298-Pelagomonas_calceolata.AAC.1
MMKGWWDLEGLPAPDAPNGKKRKGKGFHSLPQSFASDKTASKSTQAPESTPPRAVNISGQEEGLCKRCGGRGEHSKHEM